MKMKDCQAGVISIKLLLIVFMGGAVAAQASTLRVAVVGEPQETLPTIHFHAPGKLLTQHIGEGLVGLRNDLSIAPVLADSWTVSDDGRSYTFKIRTGARFHNGAPVTATDIAENWSQLYLNKSIPWDCRPFYDGSGTIEERTTGVELLSVRAVDSDRIEFKLREASSLFLHRLADASCGPLVFHGDSFDADGRWNALIGTGPYRLGTWLAGKQVSMLRFDQYVPRKEARDGYAGAREALIDEIQLLIAPSADDAVAMLQAGEVDLVQNIDNRQRDALLSNPQIATASTANVTYWNLIFQTRDPVLGNLTLRQGIARAIDIDRIAAMLSAGRLSANPSVVSAMSEHYSAAHALGQGYDPIAARKLIEKSGYTGALIRIQAARDLYPELFDIAVMAQAMMQDAGLNVEVDPMSWHELKDEHYMNGTYQMQAFLIGGRISPTLAYGKFIGPKDKLARYYWDNDEALRLVEKAETVGSPAALGNIYESLHRMMIDEVPQIVIANRDHHDAFNIRVHGIQPTHFGRTALWGVKIDAD
jgi:peptide/nickel transport system substrate-binding protein